MDFGIFHLMGTALVTGARLMAATTPAAIAASSMRRSMSGIQPTLHRTAHLETLRCLNFRYTAGWPDVAFRVLGGSASRATEIRRSALT